MAQLQPGASGPLSYALKAILDSEAMQSIRQTGIDLRNDVQRIGYCQLGSKVGAGGSFVVVLSGRFTPGTVDALSSGVGGNAKQELLGDTRVTQIGRMWIAHRGKPVGSGDLVIASGPNLLRVALTDPAGSYHLDPAAPVSAVIGGAALQRLAAKNAAGTDFKAVRELTLMVPPEAGLLVARFVIGDEATAAPFAQKVQPAVSVLAASVSGPAGPGPQVTTAVEAGDVVVRIVLPPGALDALAARMTVPTRRR